MNPSRPRTTNSRLNTITTASGYSVGRRNQMVRILPYKPIASPASNHLRRGLGFSSSAVAGRITRLPSSIHGSAPQQQMLFLLVMEGRLEQAGLAKHVTHRRALRPILDVRPLVAREVSAGGDVDSDLLQSVVPVRGVLRPRNRTRVDVSVGLHLEPVELDAGPRAVEHDRFGDARGQPKKRCLDR